MIVIYFQIWFLIKFKLQRREWVWLKLYFIHAIRLLHYKYISWCMKKRRKKERKNPRKKIILRNLGWDHYKKPWRGEKEGERKEKLETVLASSQPPPAVPVGTQTSNPQSHDLPEAITTISQTNPLSASPHQQLSFFLGRLPKATEKQHPKTQWFQPQAATKQRQVFLWTQLQQQPILFGPAFRATPISQRNNNKQRRLLLS